MVGIPLYGSSVKDFTRRNTVDFGSRDPRPTPTAPIEGIHEKATLPSGTSPQVKKPLRAWPLRGGHWANVPEIFGLDEYPYEIGTRMAGRAEQKFGQEVAKVQEQALPAMPARPSSAPARSRLPSRAGQGNERVFEAAEKGSAVILWNTAATTSAPTDQSIARLKKRRQRLTDRLLKDVVVSSGHPYRVIKWWFSIFDFYCDAPVDVALPVFRESDSDAMSTQLLHNKKSPSSSGHIFFSSADRRSSPHEKLARPTLRDKPETYTCPKGLVEEGLWKRRKKELHRAKGHLKDICRGDLDFIAKLQHEWLSQEKLSSWKEAFENKRNLLEKHRKARLATVKHQYDEKGRRLGMTEMQLNVFKMKEGLNLDNLNRLTSAQSKLQESMSEASIDDESGSSSAESVGNSYDDNNCLVDGRHITADEVMLRSSSFVMLRSKLLRGEKANGVEKPQQTREEVKQERHRILKGISPICMAAENLFNMMSCFGLAKRKACDRMYAYLLSTQEPASQTHGLHFETFYSFIKLLEGGSARIDVKTRGGHLKMEQLQASEVLKRMVEWQNSEVLKRLMFAILIGKCIPHTESAAAKRVADLTAAPLPLSNLMDSLRLVLCPGVLIRVDSGGPAGSEHAKQTSSSICSTGAGGKELLSLAEYLWQSLMQAEAEIQKEGEDSSVADTGISFKGFEQFVLNWPDVYFRFVLLLLPLADAGGHNLAEEMSNLTRHLEHRAAENRAHMKARTQVLQKKHLNWLINEFAK